MRNDLDPLILDLLEWVGREPRSYADVIDAWRTSCPRLTVWEDAMDRGFAVREHAPGHDELLWAAVGELPERQRSAVVLRFVADMRHREIAESIGCSEEAARSSLREGLNKLRKVVEV